MDMWMDVDAALTEVPVNILPLIDDTDFKSRETAIAYNEAGMDLVWNFTTTAGVTTQTAVTPTTAGDYDWTHKGDGMYTIEIPASGGISINNDTEGFGWFSGYCTGVLPWRGPIIGFRAAALNNALIDGGDTLDVNVTTVSDQSQTANDNGLDINTLITEMAKVPKSDGAVSWNATALAAINAECDTALTDYDAVVAADFPLAANVTQIDGNATNGNNATLNLKQLNIVNSAGSAILATSSGGNGHGFACTGNGTGEGINAVGGSTGHGAHFVSGTGATGDGILAQAQSTNGNGLRGISTGSGSDFNGDLGGTINGLTATALADMFDTDSGTTYASAVSGSVVKEIADNAGGSALTEAGIADAVWNELSAGHTDAGKAGAQLWTDIDAILTDTGTDGVTVTELKASALADMFNTDSGTTYSSAVAGSPVKEIADNAGGGGDATAANQTTIITHLTDVKGTGFVKDTHSLPQCLSGGGAAGAGAYSTTITIRTTGGTPLAGVGVWVNTSNDMSAAVAGTSYTNASGTVTFNLDYTTHYVFCDHAGYNFAAYNFTSSAGNVTFTADIATATSAGSSSVYDNSFITRGLATVRELVDEPTINKKYTDARIITQLEKSYTQILGEVNRNSRTPAVGVYSISVNAGQSSTQSFALPHNRGMILAVYVEGDYGERYPENSRGRHNLLGRGVWIEGDTLKVQAQTVLAANNSSTVTLKVEHVPVGVAQLHNGTLTLDADGDLATLGASPNAGALDTHAQAYLGCTLRILEVDGTTVTGNVMQERTITDYNNTTREATLDVALSPIPTTDDGSIYYEIAPTIHKGMDEIVATYTAYVIALGEGNHKRANGILKKYQNEIRTVRLTSYYSRVDEATKPRADSYDLRRYVHSNRRR